MGINVIVDDEIIRGGLLAIGANINMEGSVKGGLKAYGGHVVISGTSQDRVDFDVFMPVFLLLLYFPVRSMDASGQVKNYLNLSGNLLQIILSLH